jgi:thiol:disulfide interchange protein
MKIIKLLFIAMVLLGLCGVFIPGNAHSKGIRWQSYADGMARSKSENKKMFVHFYADWCSTCKIMEKKTFKDPGVIAALNKNYVPVKVNVDKSRKISEIFKIKLLPDTWFIAKDNEIIGHRPGYIAPEQLKALLKMFLEDDL